VGQVTEEVTEAPDPDLGGGGAELRAGSAQLRYRCLEDRRSGRRAERGREQPPAVERLTAADRPRQVRLEGRRIGLERGLHPVEG
jgi:hypothetical protein